MRIIANFLLISSLAIPASAYAQAKLESEDDQAIYVMGVMMGRSVPQLGFNPREIEVLTRGLSDQVAGGKLAVDLATFNPEAIKLLVSERQAQVAAAERKESDAFLKQQAKVKGAKQLESGLIFTETEAGTGAQPAATDTVSVHYHGTLRDGTVFDSSRDRGEPTEFPIDRVIPCWTEALQRMKVGGKAVVVCPADIAYGDRGYGSIKPGAALKFEVELLAIKQP